MYVVKKVSETDILNGMWDNIESICIDNYPWDENGYKPKAEVKLVYTDDCLFIRFIATEKEPRVEESEFNSSVFQDSCVEAFILPDPSNDDRYFNFEINARGTLLLQLDNKIRNRESLDFINPKYFEIVTDINSSNYKEYNNYKPWKVEYKIPFRFIKTFFENFEVESGRIMKANFTKCGDKTSYKHYGTWAYIENEKPAFHRPQFFKEIVLE